MVSPWSSVGQSARKIGDGVGSTLPRTGVRHSVSRRQVGKGCQTCLLGLDEDTSVVSLAVLAPEKGVQLQSGTRNRFSVVCIIAADYMCRPPEDQDLPG